MKAQFIVFGILSGVAFLAWFGWHYVKALGSAFGNANPSTGPGDVTWVFIVVGLCTAACVAASFFVPASAGGIVALAPLALILLAHGFIEWRTKANFDRYHREREAARSARDRTLDGISRDFVVKDPKPVVDDFKHSFLTHDREAGVFVRIDVGHESGITAFPFGRIDGAHLDALESGAGFEMYYRRYVDPEGKSVFDRYAVRHRPDQDVKPYRLERYGR